MKTATLEGVTSVTFKIGKKKFIGLNLIEFIAQNMKVSKSEAKRLISDGAVDIQFKVDEIISNIV